MSIDPNNYLKKTIAVLQKSDYQKAVDSSQKAAEIENRQTEKLNKLKKEVDKIIFINLSNPNYLYSRLKKAGPHIFVKIQKIGEGMEKFLARKFPNLSKYFDGELNDISNPKNPIESKILDFSEQIKKNLEKGEVEVDFEKFSIELATIFRSITETKKIEFSKIISLLDYLNNFEIAEVIFSNFLKKPENKKFEDDLRFSEKFLELRLKNSKNKKEEVTKIHKEMQEFLAKKFPNFAKYFSKNNKSNVFDMDRIEKEITLFKKPNKWYDYTPKKYINYLLLDFKFIFNFLDTQEFNKIEKKIFRKNRKFDRKKYFSNQVSPRIFVAQIGRFLENFDLSEEKSLQQIIDFLYSKIKTKIKTKIKNEIEKENLSRKDLIKKEFEQDFEKTKNIPEFYHNQLKWNRFQFFIPLFENTKIWEHMPELAKIFWGKKFRVQKFSEEILDNIFSFARLLQCEKVSPQNMIKICKILQNSKNLAMKFEVPRNKLEIEKDYPAILIIAKKCAAEEDFSANNILGKWNELINRREKAIENSPEIGKEIDFLNINTSKNEEIFLNTIQDEVLHEKVLQPHFIKGKAVKKIKIDVNFSAEKFETILEEAEDDNKTLMISINSAEFSEADFLQKLADVKKVYEQVTNRFLFINFRAHGNSSKGWAMKYKENVDYKAVNIENFGKKFLQFKTGNFFINHLSCFPGDTILPHAKEGDFPANWSTNANNLVNSINLHGYSFWKFQFAFETVTKEFCNPDTGNIFKKNTFAADLNGDGKVNLVELSLWRSFSRKYNHALFFDSEGYQLTQNLNSEILQDLG